MRIEPHANLTIALIRRNLYSPIRYRTGYPGYPPAPPDMAYRQRMARDCQPQVLPPPLRCAEPREDMWRPIYWPHDVEMVNDALGRGSQASQTAPGWPRPVDHAMSMLPAQPRGTLVDVLA